MRRFHLRESKLKYRLALFDFDGTLADSFPFFVSVMNTLADQHGFRKIRADEIDTLRTLEAKQILAEVGVPLWKLPTIGNSFKAMMAARIEQIPLFEGTAAMLQRLSQGGMKIGVVTSNAEGNVRQVLGAAAAQVNFYECGVAMFGKRAKIRRVLRQAQCAEHEAILIGDELRDAQAAQGERIAFGAVGWGYNTLEALLLQRPVETFRHMDEIAERLLGQS